MHVLLGCAEYLKSVECTMVYKILKYKLYDMINEQPIARGQESLRALGAPFVENLGKNACLA